MDINNDKQSLTSGHGGDEWTETFKIRGPRRGTVELESRTARKSARRTQGEHKEERKEERKENARKSASEQTLEDKRRP